MGNARARGSYDERVVQAVQAGRAKPASPYGVLAQLLPRKKGVPIAAGFLAWWASHPFRHAPKASRSWTKHRAKGRAK